MKAPATNSSLDVAYWFIDRAEQDNLYLENEKLQHLLFLSQKLYAQENDRQMLMPCLFLCDEQGFFEPTLKKIFTQGRPFMRLAPLDSAISEFLENIWHKYGTLSVTEFKRVVMQMPIYAQCYRQGERSVVEWDSLVDKSSQYGTMYDSTLKSAFRKKVLVSQNGPVVVSQWQPRKVHNKDYLHE